MAKQKRRIKGIETDNQGFTLLEVLVAMVIATIGLVGVAFMQTYAIQGNGTGSKYTKATFLAQERMERIKDGNFVTAGTFGYIDMAAYAGASTLDSGSDSNIDENGAAGGPFTLAWTVSTATNWARRINVNVNWLDTGGVARSVQLESLSRGDGN